jgi:DNA-binding transcriptional LysR family regulator
VYRGDHVDLAVGGPKVEELKSELLHDARLVAVTWPGWLGYGAESLTLNQLAEFPIAVPRRGFFSRGLFDRAADQAKVSSRVEIEANSTGVILRYGEERLAIPVFSEDLLRSTFRPGVGDAKLLPILDSHNGPLTTKVHIHSKPPRKRSEPIATFIEVTKSLAAEAARSLN